MRSTGGGRDRLGAWTGHAVSGSRGGQFCGADSPGAKLVETGTGLRSGPMNNSVVSVLTETTELSTLTT